MARNRDPILAASASLNFTTTPGWHVLVALIHVGIAASGMVANPCEPTSTLSLRGRLTLEALQGCWAGRPPRWIEVLAPVPMSVPQELLAAAGYEAGAGTGSATARKSRHPLAYRQLSVEDIRTAIPIRDNVRQQAVEVTVEQSRRQWWSGGNSLFNATAQCAAFFECLFRTIRDTPVVGTDKLKGQSESFCHVLSHQDLFHGHVFVVHPSHRATTRMESCSFQYGRDSDEDAESRQAAQFVPSADNSADWRQRGQAEVGVVFHAKECPSDLMAKASPDSGYDSEHPAYSSRNLVWLASSNTIYVWRPPLHPSRWEGLLQLGTEWHAMSEELQQLLTAESHNNNDSDHATEWQDSAEHNGEAGAAETLPAVQAPHRRAYTLSEAGFRELGAIATAVEVSPSTAPQTRDVGDRKCWNPWECDVNLLLRAVGDGSECNKPPQPGLGRSVARQSIRSGVIFAWTCANPMLCNGAEQPCRPGDPEDSEDECSDVRRRSRL